MSSFEQQVQASSDQTHSPAELTSSSSSLEDDVQACVQYFQLHSLCPFHADDQQQQQRRQLQNPAIFAVPSLSCRAFWDLEDVAGRVEEAATDIWAEFCAVGQTDLVSERIQRDVLSGDWQAFYLMREGGWDESVLERMPRTKEWLQTLPIMQNG